MCFSLEADLVVGAALLPVAAVSLREVRCARELPFASLPLLFALHHLVEALVWAGAEGTVSSGVQHAAALAYLIFAFPVLPILLPLAVLLLEPHGARGRIAVFVVLGAVVSGHFAWELASGPIEVTARPHGLTYVASIGQPVVWTSLYILAVIGPSLLSGYRSIVLFGAVNLVGLSLVAIVYAQAFASLWCVWAAVSSLLVAAHMVRRRRLPDSHRLHADPHAVAAWVRGS